MARIKMDAELVANSIRKGDFSKLHGKSFEMCDNTNMGKKYTLNQLGMTVDKLGMTVDKLTVTVNQIGKNLEKLTKYVTEGFKRIDTRLDYIVKANNLKDLPKNK